jgi:flagella basal body P-ring formation protein FlgA
LHVLPSLKICIVCFFIFIANNTFVAAQNIDAEKYIRNEINNKIIKEYPNLTDKDISIIIKNKEIFDELPNNADSFEIDLTKIKTVLGNTVINLKMWDKKKQFLDQKTVLLKVVAKTNFVAAARNIKAGEIITEEVLTTVYNDIYGKPKSCFFNKDELLGKQAKNFIAKNSLITDYAICNRPIINQGDKVTIIGTSGKIKLEFEGQALNNGAAGEKITVKSYKYNKKFKGEVIDSQNVKVELIHN